MSKKNKYQQKNKFRNKKDYHTESGWINCFGLNCPNGVSGVRKSKKFYSRKGRNGKNYKDW